MAWAKNGTPVTLTSTGDDLDITDLTAYKFNQILIHTPITNQFNIELTFDNNSNTDYASRLSSDGGPESTVTSNSSIRMYDTNATSREMFNISYIVNIDSEEKLVIFFTGCAQAGASIAPDDRKVGVGKCDTSTNTSQFTRIDINNPDTGSYQIDSNISAIGTD